MSADVDTAFGCADAFGNAILGRILARPLDHALFFDVDGTLLDIAASPDEVVVPVELPEQLQQLSGRCGGALALVSGRSIAWLDGRFEQLITPIGGLHGLERRDATGCIQRLDAPPMLATARSAILAALAELPGVLVEDKGLSIALHYRSAPEQRHHVKSLVVRLAEASDGTLEALPGKAVAELRTAGAHKGSAVSAFLTEPPFAGRIPVFFGDDRTDEDAFAVVRAKGGIAVAVGQSAEDVGATLTLPDPAAVRSFIARSAAPARTGAAA